MDQETKAIEAQIDVWSDAYVKKNWVAPTTTPPLLHARGSSRIACPDWSCGTKLAPALNNCSTCEGAGAAGGGGAVRIIWGPGRSFPSTNTQDK